MTISKCLRPLAAAVAAAAALTLSASSADSTATKTYKKYIPAVHGTLRTFYQQSTVTGESRFIVQNARISAGGYIMDWLDYFLQVDFCAQGKIRILDVYAAVVPVDGLRLMLGQSKAPFSTITARAPHKYYFANTPCTFKAGNIRSVGLRASYAVPSTPLVLEGGAYNGSDMADHGTWNNSLLYSTRATLNFDFGLTPSAGFMSRRPSGTGTRFNEFNISLSYKVAQLYLEGEYLYRHYTGSAHKATHMYYAMADYGFPVKARMADRLSLQARLDGCTDYSDALAKGADGHIYTTMPSHRRITVGATASKAIGPVKCDFLINFEQYFYGHAAATPSAADNNMLVAGLNIRF